MNLTNTQTSFITHLKCSKCSKSYNIHEQQSFATCCNKPLVAAYESNPTFGTFSLKNRAATMWRYREMLPVLDDANIVSLGEGMTPILSLNRLAAQLGLNDLQVKDESLNPTGSFKARGLSMAISKAKELGAKHCVVPTAGNAGGAMAAYCASAGIKATVIMPSHTPKIFQQECQYYGAELILVKGLINECGALAAKIEKEQGAYNISTLKEPYRLEGKKTMGYEIAEQLDWQLPDVILYPTGGGTGLLGIWKAFHEMIDLGWLKPDVKLPRMVVVQAANCSPVVDSLNGITKDISEYTESLANGLAVPIAFGQDMIHRVVKESGGTSVTVSEQEMIDGVKEIAKHEGMLVAPEGAALWKAIPKLIASKEISRDEKIMMINTGSGYKYLENLS
ncbi:threonine synthase [Roseivirga echinicomitans]